MIPVGLQTVTDLRRKNMPVNKKVDLKGLFKEIPVKWKVQSVSRWKATAVCVAYIDARDVMNILDEVVGIENWQDEYIEIRNNLYCKLSLKINGEWISKMGCGTESMTEKEKGEESSALKRAGVKFGIGRFTYSVKVQSVTTNEPKTDSNHPYPVDGSGNRIWNLTEHIENVVLRKSSKPPSQKESLVSTLKKLFANKLFTQVPDEHRRSIGKALESKNVNLPAIQPWIDYLTKYYIHLGKKEDKITQDDISKMMSKANKNGFSEEYVNQIVKTYKYDSKIDILVKDYEKILNELNIPIGEAE